MSYTIKYEVTYSGTVKIDPEDLVGLDEEGIREYVVQTVDDDMEGQLIVPQIEGLSELVRQAKEDAEE